MWRDEFDGKEDIKLLTFRNLLRVVKNKKLYTQLRLSFAITDKSAKNGVSSIYYNIPQFRHIVNMVLKKNDSELHFCWDYKTLLERIEDTMYRPHFDDNDKETIIQYYVTELINALLRVFLEPSISRSNIRDVEVIGNETFTMTCNELFGEGFEDKTKQVTPPFADQIDFSQYEEFLKKIKEQMSFINEQDVNEWVRATTYIPNDAFRYSFFENANTYTQMANNTIIERDEDGVNW